MLNPTIGLQGKQPPSPASGSHFSLSRDHTFTVWSLEALARRLPSGLKQTPHTLAECPLRVRSSFPFSASHTITVLSALALARRLPSGLKQTLLTGEVCPLRVRSSCPFSA